MKNVVLKNITDKADRAANNWNKTKNPKYKQEWYKLVRSVVVADNKTLRDKGFYLPPPPPKGRFF
jgi:hypothetical protein|tara:strand:- start:153 stop:347 length:195 start_codon:yes stop_codon:yes gene_type:complete